MRKIRRRNVSASRYSLAQIVTPIVLAFMVAAGGAGLAFYQTRKTSSQVSSAVQEVDAKKEALPPDLSGLLPATTVQELASSSGGSPVADMALENRSGVLVYAVTLTDGTTLGFDAASGNSVTLQGQDTANTAPQQQLQEKKDRLPTDSAINTSFEEARRLAQEAFPNGAISQIKLIIKGGVTTLSVIFADKAEVDINAESGVVVRVATPAGAIAEVPADTPAPDLPVQNPSSADPQTSADERRSSVTDDSKAPDRSENAKKEPGKAPVRVEGVLTADNGVYTLTENDVTYVIKADRDLEKFTDKTVRIEGKLEGSSTIVATNIRPSQ